MDQKKIRIWTLYTQWCMLERLQCCSLRTNRGFRVNLDIAQILLKGWTLNPNNSMIARGSKKNVRPGLLDTFAS